VDWFKDTGIPWISMGAYHHQPINVPTAGAATAAVLPYGLHIRRTSHIRIPKMMTPLFKIIKPKTPQFEIPYIKNKVFKY
jgi:hypothetical protein